MLPERLQRNPAASARVRNETTAPGRPQLVSPEMVWRGPEYPLLTPGIYLVRGTNVQGPVWLRSFQRWSIRIEFALVSEPGNVSAFYNLGSDRSALYIGRQSKYFKDWVLANGEHPRKGQKMTADVFLDGQFFDVEVGYCNRNPAGEQKAEAEIYSQIKRLVSVRRA